jgi:type I restriction enzyme S subunit
MAFTITVAELIDADTSGLLGKHPSWERVPLADIASILNGAPFDSALFSTAEGMPLVRIRDVIAGETNTYYTGTYEDAYLVRHGDFLVGMDGDFNSGYWGPKTALLNQRVCKISPVEAYYDKRLLGFTLPGYLAAINANTPSVTVKHLSSKTIGEIDLPLPPRAEQTRIVEKLEELLSDLDAGVAELKAARKKLGQYRQSLLKAAVEGALTAEWRKQNVPFETGAQLLDRILLERRARWEAKQLAKFKEQGKIPPKDWQKKYPEPVQPDTTNLPELPEGWVWAKVAQTGEVQLGRQRAPQYHAGSNMVPYLRVANVFENRIDISDVMEMHFSEKEEQLFKLHANDILLNEGQSLELVGRPAIYRNELPLACFTNTLVRFRAEDGVIPEFALTLFLHYMHSGRFRKIATITTNIAHLGAGRFAEVEFPLPSTEEQREIMSTLTETMENLVRQQDAISLALKQSTAQRQNILRAAFAGQLVPQDPTDEPASVLLERIRAERAAHAAVKKPRGRKVREATA